MRRKRQMATAALALASAAALAATAGGASAQSATPAPPPKPAADVTVNLSGGHRVEGEGDVLYTDEEVVFEQGPAPDVVRLPQLNINVAPPQTTVEIDSPFITVGPGERFSIRPEGLSALKRSLEDGRWRADVNVAEGPVRARFSRSPDGTFLLAQAPPPAAPQPARPAQPAQPGQPGKPPQAPRPADVADPANADPQRLAELYRAQLGEKLQMQKAAYLGVSTSPVPPPLRQHLGLPEGVGLVVDFVESGSPAEQGGVKQYDILKKFDDQVLVNAQQLAVLVRTRKGGDEVKLQLVRGGKEETVSAKLVEKDVPPLEAQRFWQGDGDVFRQGAFRQDPNAFRWEVRPDGRGGFEFGRGTARRVTPNANRNQDKGSATREERTERTVNDRAVMVWRDNDYVLTVTGSPQDRHLVATDQSGKVLFQGHLDRDGGREKMPKEVRERLERFEKQRPDTRQPPKPPGEEKSGRRDGDGQHEERIDILGEADAAGADSTAEVRIERSESKDARHEEHEDDDDDGDDDNDDDGDDDDGDDDGRRADGEPRIRRGDVLQISVSDLQGPGVETVKRARVRSGEVSLPYIGGLKAEGLSERELERTIVRKYRDAKLIHNATVSVELVARGDRPADAQTNVPADVRAPGKN